MNGRGRVAGEIVPPRVRTCLAHEFRNLSAFPNGFPVPAGKLVGVTFPTRQPRRRDLPLPQAQNPLDPLMRFLDSTMFLSFIAFLIICFGIYAVWRG